MKKLVSMIIFLSTFFLFTTHVSAALTTFQRVSNANGEVTISLNTNEGYVRGYDFSILIEGNVGVQGMRWDTSFLANTTLEYSYDSNSHVLHIYVASGDDKNNLVTSDGTIKIGTVLLSNPTPEEVTYNIIQQKLTIVNMDYVSIAKNDIALDNENTFVYKVSNNNSNNNGDSNHNNNNNNNGNEDQGKVEPKPDEPLNPDEKDSNPTDNSNNDKNQNNSNDKNDSNKKDETNKKEDQKTNEETTNETEEEPHYIVVLVVVSVLALIVLGVIGYMVYKNRHAN